MHLFGCGKIVELELELEREFLLEIFLPIADEV
jgi:hypothetical protein